MKTHLILILLLIVAVPMLTLGWMGNRMLDSEYGMVQYQFKKTLVQRLQDVDAGIASDLELIRTKEASAKVSSAALWRGVWRSRARYAWCLICPETDAHNAARQEPRQVA